jgi:CopG antitoxin of type II toxin-antitoxin system
MARKDNMAESKTSVSNVSSDLEIGEFWDHNDLSEHWDKTHEVEMQVDAPSSAVYFAVEKALAAKLRSAAETHGISPETLLNLWVREHISAEATRK